MIILDTNVVSEPMRRTPDPNVVRWLDSLDLEEVALTSVTAAELLYGVALLEPGKRREELDREVHAVLFEEFDSRIAPFDVRAAARYADICATHKKNGWGISTGDAQIAAICLIWSATLATRNTTHFTHTGVNVINPWNEVA